MRFTEKYEQLEIPITRDTSSVACRAVYRGPRRLLQEEKRQIIKIYKLGRKSKILGKFVNTMYIVSFALSENSRGYNWSSLHQTKVQNMAALLSLH